MADKIVFKPYKRKLNTWINMDEREDEETGRVIFHVAIGEKQIQKEENKTETEELAEDIYMDILQNFFLNRSGYNLSITLPCEPKIVLSYDGRLVYHNDKIQKYEEQVISLLRKMKINPAVQAMVNYVANENSGEKYSDTLRRIQKNVNQYLDTNFPPEFIALVLKNYICEDKRDMPEKAMEYSCMDYQELLEKAGNIIIHRDKQEENEEEAYVLDELLYRFLQGSLVMKG